MDDDDLVARLAQLSPAHAQALLARAAEAREAQPGAAGDGDGDASESGNAPWSGDATNFDAGSDEPEADDAPATVTEAPAPAPVTEAPAPATVTEAPAPAPAPLIPDYESAIREEIGADGATIAVIDIETDGREITSHILQIAVKVVDEKDNRTYTVYVMPPHGVVLDPHSTAIKINGLTRPVLESHDAVDIKTALSGFVSFMCGLKDYVIVAHNVPFDLQFLAKALLDNDFDVVFEGAPTIDTLAMARDTLGRPSNDLNCDLGSVYLQAFSVPLKGAHGAVEDADAAFLLLCYFIFLSSYNLAAHLRAAATARFVVRRVAAIDGAPDDHATPEDARLDDLPHEIMLNIAKLRSTGRPVSLDAFWSAIHGAPRSLKYLASDARAAMFAELAEIRAGQG